MRIKVCVLGVWKSTKKIRFQNVSRFPVAFALKSNAIPRVIAFPPCGVLAPDAQLDVAVTIQARSELESFLETIPSS